MILARTLRTLAAAAVAALLAHPAAAADCPGNPAALGTSRTLVVDPAAHPAVGSQQVAESLPLEDHEIVLTFDDGPIPRYSGQVLDILARECVKAVFFEVGEMSRDHPDGIRRLIAEGHTVGTHTMHHPLDLNRAPAERIAKEIDGGIREARAAADDAAAIAPFFRPPGLVRGAALEAALRGRSLMEWDVDFSADDWHRISADRVAELAIARIEERGRGILLLHDIHQRTVDALPAILRELKARGYRIVEVVPATAERPATPVDASLWTFRPAPKDPLPAQAAGPKARMPAPAEMFRADAKPDRGPMPAIDETGSF